MIQRTTLFLSLMASLAASPVFAQQGMLTVGLQVRPLIPSSFFIDEAEITEGDVNASLSPKGGYSFGMMVRYGFSDLFAMETGINFISRNYNRSYSRESLGFVEEGDITFVGYEIPILAMVYVRLGERTYMNVATGPSLDFFPSDVETASQELLVYFFREGWIRPALAANLGFEFRTEKSGIFYLGATYHRPFGNMVVADFTHYENQVPTSSVRMDLSGTYLTLDLRYYFHSDPDKKSKRKVDRSNRDGL